MFEVKKKIIEIPAEYLPEIEDLPGGLSRIAAEIERYRPGSGVELTLFLAQVFAGQPLYLRSIKDLLRKIRNDAIIANYDAGGVTMLQLASTYNLSHRRIKEILAAPGGPTKNDKQLELPDLQPRHRV